MPSIQYDNVCLDIAGIPCYASWEVLEVINIDFSIEIIFEKYLKFLTKSVAVFLLTTVNPAITSAKKVIYLC